MPKMTLDKLRQLFGLRRVAYRQVFKGPYGDTVLKDLAKFCRANVSTFDQNDRAHVLAEGRREVWLRIQNNLQLSPEQLWRLTYGDE